VPAGLDYALVLVAAGLGAGFLSGLAGMGGAFVLVPVLAFGTGMPFKAATGAAVLHGLGTAVSAWIVHRRRGVVEQRVGLIGGAGGVVGGIVGALISAIVSALTVKVIYAATVLLALVLLVARPEPAEGNLARTPHAHARAVGIGAVTGVLAGIVGAGGAFLLLPLLRSLLALPIHRAMGTTMLVSIFIASSATLGKVLLGQVLWPDAAFVVVGSGLGSQLGASLTHRLPARPLRTLLVAVLLVLLARTLLDVLAG
jgi:uncharacterized membrane protein YfcA